MEKNKKESFEQVFCFLERTQRLINESYQIRDNCWEYNNLRTELINKAKAVLMEQGIEKNDL